MSNLHSKQTGKQVHKPEGFETANNNSILTKYNDNTKVRYIGKPIQNTTVITAIADVSGSLNNKYFTAYTEFNSSKYYFYFNVNQNGTVPKLDDSFDKITETVKTATTAVIDYTKSTIDQADN